jgi:hypothetical protein
MSASTGCGHAVLFGYAREVPKAAVSRPYSITSSARASSVAGMSRPSTPHSLQVDDELELGSSRTAGNSAGFSPLRMRPV